MRNRAKNIDLKIILRVTLIYLAFSVLWILLSDRLLALLVADADTMTRLQTFKGLAFVVTSALIIYVLLSNELRRRRRAEQAYIKSEARYRELFNSNPDAVFIFDLDGQIVDANKVAESRYGYGRQELLGMNVRELAAADLRDSVDPKLREVLDGKVLFEWRQQRRDGSEIPVEISAQCVHIEDRKQILSIARDISERKEAEEAFRESEERYLSLFNQSLNCIYVHDLEGNFLDANDAALRLFGYEKDEIYNLNFKDIVGEEYLAKAYETIREILITGSQKELTEYKLLKKNGEPVWILTEASLVYRYGRPHCLLGFAMDITGRKQLEEQLQQTTKMEAIGRLAGGVAHDFNNALTPMLALSDMLLRRWDADEKTYSYMKEIKQSGERCAALTRQLLAFGRRQPLKMQALNLNHVVMNIEKMLSRLLGEDIELTRFLAPDLKSVRADAGQMDQVLVNLAVNSRDSMPSGGKLTIETANVHLDREYAETRPDITPGPHVMLAMSDTGHGMDEETLEHIFEPFFTTKEKGKGTGLGLSTVYGIVKQCGGNIWVYSEEGRGATFKIYLPAVDEEPEELINPESLGEGKYQGTETILLVEDEDSVRKIEKQLFEENGYTVRDAPDGEEALRICEERGQDIKLMITDVVMPGMSGRELADRLASTCPHIKVIFMSGYTENSIVHHGVLEEGVHFIQKPFNNEALLRKVRELLDETYQQ